MSAFQDIAKFNDLIGNFQGNLESVNWDAVDAQMQLIKEEFTELELAVSLRNTSKIRDGIADVHVTTSGLAHRMGVDGDSDLYMVNESNMSKFCTSESEALATCKKYEALGIEVILYYPADGYIAVKSAKDQFDETGTYYPKGKLLKSVNFIEPIFD